MSESPPDFCPFCAMTPGRILDARKHAFAVLDAFPVSPGHTLIVFRRHVADIFDLTPCEIRDFVRLIQSAKARINRDRQPAGFNVGVNVGRAAGQTVMHAHVHVIPRYPGDVDDPTGGVRGVIPHKAQFSLPRADRSGFPGP
jgi:diadenosine tetraphosphate (Ap4A) HIT family hydrolase